jgi:iron complex transport system ATP-binding protein
LSSVEPAQPGIAHPILELENVTVWRGTGPEQRPALDRISLTIRESEHTAIVGPNGSGKSTLIKLLTREVYPRYPDCTLRILGRDRWHVDELRSLLGIVTNDLVTACTQNYPAREIVLSGFFAAIGVWPWHEVTPQMEARADELLELVGLSGLESRPMTAMSSGEVRRAVLARALVHQPKALVLDEPTNSLDIAAFRELRAAMSRLAGAGTTIVLVTHHLPDLIPQIQRVAALREGRIVADGPAGEVLTSARLEAVFGTPVSVFRHGDVWTLH